MAASRAKEETDLHRRAVLRPSAQRRGPMPSLIQIIESRLYQRSKG